MARLESVAKQGFYPTPPIVGELISRYLRPTEAAFSALDPCCGEGTALRNLVGEIGKNGKAYGVEINSNRARKAGAVLDKALNIDLSSLDCPKGAFSVLFLNPPYDNDGDGERLEKVFLAEATKYLRTSGLLIFIIPQNQIFAVSTYLSAHYKDIRTFQFPKKEYRAFGQVVLFGVKKDGVTLDDATREELNRASWGDAVLPALSPQRKAPFYYTVPPALLKGFGFCSLSVKLEAAREEADARGLWKDGTFLQDLYGETNDTAVLHPLLPLKKGHLALLLTSGGFNNQVLEKDRKRVIVKGRTYKVVDKNDNPDSGAAATETDRFVTEISVLNLKNGKLEKITPEAGLKDFLSEWKDILAGNVIANFTPTYQFEQKAGTNNALRGLKRRLLPSQEHIALAVRRYLSKNKTAIIVGEMGVGKTIISVGVSELLGSSEHQGKRTAGLWVLVMCPSHLCKKWERETTKTLHGAKVFQVTSITEFEKAVKATLTAELAGFPQKAFFILSKETAKLSYEWKPVALPNRKGDLRCPDCGILLINPDDEIPLRWQDLRVKKSKCLSCGGALWTATRILKGRGKLRYSLAKYIHDKYRRFFNLLVVDEAHQYKASGSAQGQGMSLLVSSAKKVLALTGTIFGGRSTSLFYILYRLTNEIKGKFAFRAEKEWAKRYGIIQKITKEKETSYNSDGSSSSAKEYKVLVRELPGANPDIINFLLDKTAFFKLSDLGISLPKYSEGIIECSLEKEHQWEYDKLEMFLLDEIKDALKRKRGRNDEPRRKGTVNIGLYLQMLLTYPDQPFKDYTAIDDDGETLYSAKRFEEAAIYPKEQKLIELVKSELSQNRNVWIYCTHTQTRDVTERLQRLLTGEGVSSVVMRQAVNARKREEWITKQVRAGVRVIISNPRLVETGLDLIDFPTLLFFETEYSAYTLRQSSRRSWRIGQKQEVKVFYFCYEKTIQQKALSLVAKKIKSAMMVDGDVAFEGTVASYKDEGNFFIELARDVIDNPDVRDLNSIFSEVAQTETRGDEFIRDYEIRPDEQEPLPQEAEIIPVGLTMRQPDALYIQQELFEMVST